MTQSTEQDRAELPNLSLVIYWLESGCNIPDAIAELKIYQTQIEAARRAQVVPKGWRLVPVEPTSEMIYAAHESDCEYSKRAFNGQMHIPQSGEDHWHAMIAAAPQPPEATVKESLQVDCACGDSYQADSFGAGFIAARGKCPNCDAAEAAPVQLPVLTDEQVKEIRRRAYRENGQGGCWYDVTAAIHDTEHQVRELLSHGK